MNKKGLVWFEVMMIVLFVGMVGAAVKLTPKHRERKAIEKCMADGVTTKEQCTEIVKGMPPEEILEAIKDR